MEKISVIVPVYKVEKYLNRCLISLINQTYENLEIILVDDGSPDRCGTICDKFAEQYENVTAVHKSNGGLSDARNYGLKIATGELISFIDSDDYVDEDYFEYLYELLSKYNCQMSMCGMIGEDEIGNQIKLHTKITYESGCLKSKDALCKILYQEGFDVSAWGKLYRRFIFDNLQFKVGILYEDFEIIDKTVLSCDCIAYGSKPKYHYIQHTGSIMSKDKFDKKIFYLIELSNNKRKKYFEEKELKNAVVWRDVYSKLIVLNRMIKVGNSKVECQKEINELCYDLNSILCDKRVQIKYKMVLLLLKLIPGLYFRLIKIAK